jgi:recombination protein RecT
MNTTVKPDTKQLAEPQERPATIIELLEKPDTKKRLAAVLPKHLSADRMMRVCALAIHKTPLLAQCSWVSLLGSIMIFASLGIEPNTPLGHGYLIPFKKKRKQKATKEGERDQWTETVEVQPIIGYRGFVDLAYRSRMVTSLHADVVYRGDNFEFHYGTGMQLIHKPVGAKEGRDRIYAYAHASLIDGQAFEALPYQEVLAVRNKTQAWRQALADLERSKEPSLREWERDRALRSYESSPWVAYEHEMAAKTMVRRLAKMLPLSIEYANAVAADTLSEAGTIDLSAFTEPGGAAFADMSMAEDATEGDPADNGQKQLTHSTEKTLDQVQTGSNQGDKVPAGNGATAGAKGGKAKGEPQSAGNPFDGAQ